jgi:uncharacterized membrane protein YagU involved in acid resistance
MTIVMHLLRTRLPKEQHRPLPPREVIENTVEKTGAGDQLTERARTNLTGLAHFGFGAAAGALYSALMGSRKSTAWTGIGYGLGVWAGAYGIGLPSVGLHPAAWTDTRDRNEVLIAGHLVWGLALGLLADGRDARGLRPNDTRRALAGSRGIKIESEHRVGPIPAGPRNPAFPGSSAIRKPTRRSAAF